MLIFAGNVYNKHRIMPRKFASVPSWLFAIAHDTFLNHRKATRTYESLEEAKMVIDKQEAVTLYYLTGYSVKEIATISNSTEDAVKKQLSRGRDKLKSRLKR